MNQAPDTVARLREALAAFNDADPKVRERYFELYDENVVLHGYADGLKPGLTGLKDYYRKVWTALEDIKVIPEDILADGDSIACRYTLSATHTGLFMGIPATQRRFSVGGMTFMRFANGRCVERWQGMDKLSLLQQLQTGS